MNSVYKFFLVMTNSSISMCKQIYIHIIRFLKVKLLSWKLGIINLKKKEEKKINYISLCVLHFTRKIIIVSIATIKTI